MRLVRTSALLLLLALAPLATAEPEDGSEESADDSQSPLLVDGIDDEIEGPSVSIPAPCETVRHPWCDEELPICTWFDHLPIVCGGFEGPVSVNFSGKCGFGHIGFCLQGPVVYINGERYQPTVCINAQGC